MAKMDKRTHGAHLERNTTEPSLSLHFEDTSSAEAVIPTLDALFKVVKKIPGFLDERRMSIFDHPHFSPATAGFGEGDALGTPVYAKCNVNVLSAVLNRGAPFESVSLSFSAA
jgi:hypothetical protein